MSGVQDVTGYSFGGISYITKVSYHYQGIIWGLYSAAAKKIAAIKENGEIKSYYMYKEIDLIEFWILMFYKETLNFREIWTSRYARRSVELFVKKSYMPIFIVSRESAALSLNGWWYIFIFRNYKIKSCYYFRLYF
jgi:hypothetical protein